MNALLAFRRRRNLSLCDPQRSGDLAVKRREFLSLCGGVSPRPPSVECFSAERTAGTAVAGFHLTDVTARSGIQFRHNAGGYGGKLLPETLRAGWHSSITTPTAGRTMRLSTVWTGRVTNVSGRRSRCSHNNRNGTIYRRHRAAGLDVEMAEWRVAVGDFNNDGFPTCS